LHQYATPFKVVVIEHKYASIEREKAVIHAAGGELISADHLPLPEQLPRPPTLTGSCFGASP